jgi:hypothetical protein
MSNPHAADGESLGLSLPMRNSDAIEAISDGDAISRTASPLLTSFRFLGSREEGLACVRKVLGARVGEPLLSPRLPTRSTMLSACASTRFGDHPREQSCGRSSDEYDRTAEALI